MDILEKKKPLDFKEDLKKIIKLLTFKKNKVELKGSASLKSQKYPADYDLYSKVEPERDAFLTFLKDLIKKMDDSDDYYFIELKFQSGDKKIKIFPNQPIKEAEVGRLWKHLDFIKVDMIARIENRFVEVSVIYDMNPLPTTDDYKKSVEKDIKELKSEGSYYKVLKRQFNLYKASGDKKKLLNLSKIFNGDMGKEYQLISNLEAIQQVLKYYQDKQTIDKVKLNLKDLKLPDNVDTEQWVKTRLAHLNKEAEQIYKKLDT